MIDAQPAGRDRAHVGGLCRDPFAVRVEVGEDPPLPAVAQQPPGGGPMLLS
jgi:hypothetical protein